MRILTIFILCSLLQINSGWAQTSAKNVETLKKYTYFLDNGFEKIDLMQVGTIDKSFFSIGNPRLVIAHVNDKSKKNILNSFSLIVDPSDAAVHPKVFNVFSPAFTDGVRQMMSIMKPQSKITFTEVKLNVADDGNSTSPGGKYVNPIGTLPVSFFLYIK